MSNVESDQWMHDFSEHLPKAWNHSTEAHKPDRHVQELIELYPPQEQGQVAESPSAKALVRAFLMAALDGGRV
jgi:hypothetical protein